VIAATAGEAPYVLDGLLYHARGLSIEEHYTDTGGASDHVFGLMPFFGYRFAPRLRDLKDRRLHLLPGQEAGPLLAGMTGDPVAIGHVAAHWDELLRLTTSIRSGTATASAMLRRLSAYPRQNGLALALREVGRIERSIFMLDWLRDLDLRRRTQAGLTRARPATRSPARSSSTSSASCATGGSRTRPIAPPASISSWPPSSCGTPAISNRRSARWRSRRHCAPHRPAGMGAYLAHRRLSLECRKPPDRPASPAAHAFIALAMMPFTRVR
jgi:hypothetical protein